MGLESYNNLEYINDSKILLESSAFHITDSSENINSEALNSLEISSGECISEVSEVDNFSQFEHEIIYDAESVEHIANYLESFEAIKYENWSKLSLEEKHSVLCEIEENLAEIEHRPTMCVEVEKMKGGTLGYQDSSSNRIAINSDVLASDKPEAHKKILDTIIHEGRHAYQHYNVDVKLIHESGAEVESWRENFYDSKYQYYQTTGQKVYIPTEEGYEAMSDYRLYYYQPVEIDARNFSSDVLKRLENKGVFGS